jgi:hypothetical protein
MRRPLCHLSQQSVKQSQSEPELGIALCHRLTPASRTTAAMAGCLDSIDWQRPEWLDFGERRNAVASLVAGTLVSDSCSHLYPSDSLLLVHDCSSLPAGGS